MRHRARLLAAACAAVLVAAACSGSGGSTASSSSAGPATGSSTTAPGSPASPTRSGGPVSATTLTKQICANNAKDVLLRTWHGVMLGRSGEIQIIPTFPNFVNGGLTHSTPYDYTQEVPLFVYAPGMVRPGVYTKPVTLADIAPTEGALLKYPFAAPDGTAQDQALLPASQRQTPQLLVTLVWDSGGMDVLNRWPHDWPYLRSLRPKGAWFTNATVDSSPSNTPTGHAEIGTGAFPQHHGMVDEYMLMNGRIQKPNENGPAFMVTPTLADLYDPAMGNRPIVGAVATLSAHIMMMSHGSEWSGGDRDIAVTREKTDAKTAGAEATSWNLTPDMAPFYRLPSYVNALPGIGRYNRQIDAMDGKIDGMWRDNSIAQLSNGFDTPARTPFQTQLIEAVIKHEGFGKDAVPDLLDLNYKAIDTIGHAFSADSLEMSDAVKVQDQNLKVLVGYLNETVGAGKWAMVLTADHGTQHDPNVSGAFMIDIDKLTRDLETTFDTNGDNVPLFTKIRPTEIWVNHQQLADDGVTLNQISEYLMGLTQQQTIRVGRTPDPATANDTVFSAALPSTMLARLPCLPEARQGP
jgi:Type I phosphodiesterase / nucleotide pyrophosphatase